MDNKRNGATDVISSLVPSNLNLQLARPTEAQDGEISVFGAEQYFNTKLDDKNRGTIAGNPEFPADLQRIRTRGRLGTPSVRSESSLSSQRALLQSTRRNLSRGNQIKQAHKRWFFPGFACSKSCYDNKSTAVDENVGQRGHQDSRRPPNFKGMKQKILEIEGPRKSLELFGKHMINKEGIASNLERKLSVLTWDAIPNSTARTLPSNSATFENDPELEESDKSSDLFEIESISCSTKSVYTKEISGELAGYITPRSKTSVKPSVSTADMSAAKALSTSSTTRNYRANGLLGCTSQKSVNVAETSCKGNEKLMPNPDFNRQMPFYSCSSPRKLSGDHSHENFHFL